MNHRETLYRAVMVKKKKKNNRFSGIPTSIILLKTLSLFFISDIPMEIIFYAWN